MINELHTDPRNTDAIRKAVNHEIIGSDLSDSMVPGTGLPANIDELDGVPLPGPPVLVEIRAIEEVGHSAFSLLNVAEARAEHAKREAKRRNVAAENDEDAEADSCPSYPRSMLRFELSDGSKTLGAFEYARLPEIELGRTPKGYKVGYHVRPTFLSILLAFSNFGLPLFLRASITTLLSVLPLCRSPTLSTSSSQATLIVRCSSRHVYPCNLFTALF